MEPAAEENMNVEVDGRMSSDDLSDDTSAEGDTTDEDFEYEKEFRQQQQEIEDEERRAMGGWSNKLTEGEQLVKENAIQQQLSRRKSERLLHRRSLSTGVDGTQPMIGTKEVDLHAPTFASKFMQKKDMERPDFVESGSVILEDGNLQQQRLIWEWD